MEVDCDEFDDEARYFCSLAEQPGTLSQAVVAAARPESPDFGRSLESSRIRASRAFAAFSTPSPTSFRNPPSSAKM
jgi:hypothetical protein